MLNPPFNLAMRPEAIEESEPGLSQKFFSFLLPFICIQTHVSKQSFVAFQGVSQSTQPHCTGCRGHFRDASKCFNLDQTITLPPCHRLGSVPLTSLFSAFPQAKNKSQTCITKLLLDPSSWWSQSVAKHPHLLQTVSALHNSFDLQEELLGSHFLSILDIFCY